MFLCKKDFEEVIKKNEVSELKMTHCVTDYHIEVSGQSWQRTKYAVQLFSNSFGKAMAELFPEKAIQAECLVFTYCEQVV